MLAKRSILRAAAAAATTAAGSLSISPGVAQEGGLQLDFGIEHRLESTDNLALDFPAEGRTSRASTALSFALESATRTQQFSLSGSAALWLSEEPGTGSDTRIARPALRLTYGRQSANAALSFDARYREEQVEFLTPFDDGDEGEDGDGGDTDPGETTDITGTGQRINYGAKARLELGTAAPLGLIFDAGLSEVDYSSTTDPDLVDSSRRNLAATTRLRISPVTEGTVALSYATYEDSDDTERETSTVNFGVKHALSPATRFEAALGYAVIDTEEPGLSSREEGSTARLSIEYDMPDGSIEANFASTIDQNGTQRTLSFGRVLERRSSKISARLGVSDTDDRGTDLIGALSWQQALPTGAIEARLARRVRSVGDDGYQLRTLVSLGYARDINQVSAISFDLDYAWLDEIGANSVTQGTATATYSRAVNADWDMNFGAKYRLRDEDTVGKATSTGVFISLSRDFSYRP
ncbi:hypothetical protein [Candidatus Halocynthiibacter alkanivorans]|uniref:hypothetical protein n=1 Tax=Candidatus Halocynthiibacter alkanivorans TaxID=2267619 RepID=UPI000DF331D4|nr:hypothetical protein [Candidatus Halocynthiibacter alkanivorans]